MLLPVGTAISGSLTALIKAKGKRKTKTEQEEKKASKKEQ